MHQRFTRSALSYVIILACLTHTAHADRVTEAKLRFEQGAALISASEVRKGLNELLISNRLAPNPNTLLNVARSLDYLEYYEYAYLVYDQYLREPTISAADRKDAQRAFVRVGKRVARLYIETDPPNAEIFIDRKSLGEYGRTPRRIAAKHGMHKVILKAPNYQEKVIEVDLRKGIENHLSVGLTPQTGTVIISTESWVKEGTIPPVTVTQGNRLLGSVNEQLVLPVGSQEVSVNAQGYESLALTLDVTADPDPDFSFDLDDDNASDAFEESLIRKYEVKLETIKGSARILANEIGALIYLNGKEVGFTPQVIDAGIGDHRLRLELPGFKAWEGDLTVAPPPHQVVGEVEFRRPTDQVIHPAWAWSMAGLAVASAGLSVAMAIEGQKANENLPPYPTELEVADGNRYLLLADGAGALTVLSGLASYLLFRSQTQSRHDTPRARFYENDTPLEEIPPFVELKDEDEELDSAESEPSSQKTRPLEFMEK